MFNNLNVDIVNMNAYIKFGEILSIISGYWTETKFRRKLRP